MSKKTAKGIEVYLRVRPGKKPSSAIGKNKNPYLVIVLDNEGSEIQFTFKKDGEKSGNQNQKDDIHNFVFNGLLDQLTQQETVFNAIAKDVS